MLNRDEILYVVQAAMSRRINKTPLGYHFGDMYKILKDGDYGRAIHSARIIDDSNIKSLRSRYGAEAENYDFKDFSSEDFRLNCFHDFDPIQVIKAVHYIQYQNCEYVGWADSECSAFLKAVERAAVRAIDGYDDAIWGAPEKSNFRRII